VTAADLVVLVLDPTQPHGPAQSALERAFPEAMRVANKSDRPALWEPTAAIHTVATTGQGVDALRSAVRQAFLGTQPFEIDRPRWWTERQRLALQQAIRTRIAD
jgi:tRNA U34 5-carboxymethylaminomethyl modifying GTPase MnmE/TrmE